MFETEAKTKLCPKKFLGSNVDNVAGENTCRCEGSDCMGWEEAPPVYKHKKTGNMRSILPEKLGDEWELLPPAGDCGMKREVVQEYRHDY